MNTFDLLDIAVSGREKRNESMELARVTAFALDRIYTAFDRRDPPGPQQPMSRYPDLVEGPSPTVDLGTAEVDDSDYDGAPWCSGCRARTAAGCKCGPIADNE